MYKNERSVQKTNKQNRSLPKQNKKPPPETNQPNTNKKTNNNKEAKTKQKNPLETVNPCEVKKDFGVVCKYEKRRINDWKG